MASPRRRITLLLPLVLTFALWSAVLACSPSGSFRCDTPAILMAAIPPLCTNLALALILIGDWRAGTGLGPRKTTVLPEWKVIPLDRCKPAGIERRKRHHHVVVFPRHIRRLSKPTLIRQKRSAPGLPELPVGGLNRRRPSGWYRILAR